MRKKCPICSWSCVGDLVLDEMMEKCSFFLIFPLFRSPLLISSISHIQLLDSRRLMWCDEANTVIQKTLGDGMDFYMYGGMDEVLERGKGSTDIRCSIVLSRRPTTSRDQSKLSIFSHDWSMLRVIINKTGLPKLKNAVRI